jgi:hypothetical protein
MTTMNSRQRKTLAAVFASPTAADLRWTDVEAMLRALGCELEGGAGSRVRVVLKGRRAVFHRPHPGNIVKRYCVRDIRAFLESVGVKP